MYNQCFNNLPGFIHSGPTAEDERAGEKYVGNKVDRALSHIEVLTLELLCQKIQNLFNIAGFLNEGYKNEFSRFPYLPITVRQVADELAMDNFESVFSLRLQEMLQ